MIIDKELEFSLGQAETATGAHDSTNVVDLGKPGDDADELFLYIKVGDAVESAGAATVNFKLLTSDAADFATSKVLYESGALGKATLVANYEVAKVRVPRGLLRYMKVVYDIGTAALTAGSFTAAIVTEVQTNQDVF